jgi:hypothetical protein
MEDLDQEERHEQAHRREVDEPGVVAATKHRFEPGQLAGLIDGEAGRDQQERNHDHRAVCDLLSSVVLALDRLRLGEMEVVSNALASVLHTLNIGHDMTPLATPAQEEHVRKTVEEEEPAEVQVERDALGQLALELQCAVHAVRTELEDLSAEDAQGLQVLKVGPIDPHTAIHHHYQQRKVQPVHPAKRQRVLLRRDVFGTGMAIVGIQRVGNAELVIDNLTQSDGCRTTKAIRAGSPSALAAVSKLVHIRF